MLTLANAIFSNTLKLDLLCVNTWIKTKSPTDQVHFQGHIDSILGLLIFLTAGMPSRAQGEKGQTYGACGLALFLKQLNTSSNFFN